MGTPYSVVYQEFVFKIRGYELLSLYSDEREELAKIYMNSACRKFNKKSKHNLYTRTKADDGFEETLEEEEIDIITEWMVVEWLKPQLHSDELLESRLNTKDFTEFSPAKLIEQIRGVYKEAEKRVKYMTINYTYTRKVDENGKPIDNYKI